MRLAQWFRLLCLLVCTCLVTGLAQAAEPVRIAVLAGASQPEWRIEPVEIDLDSLATGKTLGKKWAANNFCGSPLSNEARCTSCHRTNS